MAQQTIIAPQPWEGYTFGDALNEGSLSYTFVGTHQQTKRKVVLKAFDRKQLDSDKVSFKKLKTALKILPKNAHENVVALNDKPFFKTRVLYNVVMQYYGGGDLARFIEQNGKIKEDEARPFMIQIANGLKHLNVQGIVLRTLKPRNIILSESSLKATLKINIFGQSRFQQLGANEMDVAGGSLAYLAPEILRKQQDHSKADLWSAGVILYYLLSRTVPFTANNVAAVLDQMAQSESIKLPHGLSNGYSALLRGLLQCDIKERSGWDVFAMEARGDDEVKEQAVEEKQIEDVILEYELKGGSMGSFIKMYEGRRKKLGHKVMVKEMDLSLVEEDKRTDLALKMNAEIKVLRKCDHSNILKLMHDDDKAIRRGTVFYIFYELWSRKTLYDFMDHIGQPLKERDARHFAQQIASGLKHVHSRGIIHRDLNPHSIFMSESKIGATLKIGGFGSARIKNLENGVTLQETNVEGNNLFMAPELLRGREDDSDLEYRSCVDLWSFGVILYQMLFNEHPYRDDKHHDNEPESLLKRIESTKLPFHKIQDKDCQTLLGQLMEQDTDKRQWKEIGNNKWLSSEEKEIDPLQRTMEQMVLTKANPVAFVAIGIDDAAKSDAKKEIKAVFDKFVEIFDGEDRFGMIIELKQDLVLPKVEEVREGIENKTDYTASFGIAMRGQDHYIEWRSRGEEALRTATKKGNQSVLK